MRIWAGIDFCQTALYTLCVRWDRHDEAHSLVRLEERESSLLTFVDNLLVRIHFIIVMIWWTGLAPWEFEFLFPGSHTSTFVAYWGAVTRRNGLQGHLGNQVVGTSSSRYAYCSGLRPAWPSSPSSLLSLQVLEGPWALITQFKGRVY